MDINGRKGWRRRPPTKPIPFAAQTSPGFVNLEGQTFGSMEVVGYLGKSGSQKSARWLARCMCGRYEPRSSKALKAPDAQRDECARCTEDRKTAPHTPPLWA